EFEELLLKVKNENPWFTPGSIDLALEGIRRYLEASQLKKWIASYNLSRKNSKTIGLVMAGNIPLAGFHDLLCVLISGHVAMAKLSSKDSILPTFLVKKLVTIEPRFEPFIVLPPRLKNFDAVIATGSD